MTDAVAGFAKEQDVAGAGFGVGAESCAGAVSAGEASFALDRVWLATRFQTFATHPQRRLVRNVGHSQSKGEVDKVLTKTWEELIKS